MRVCFFFFLFFFPEMHAQPRLPPTVITSVRSRRIEVPVTWEWGCGVCVGGGAAARDALNAAAVLLATDQIECLMRPQSPPEPASLRPAYPFRWSAWPTKWAELGRGGSSRTQEGGGGGQLFMAASAFRVPKQSDILVIWHLLQRKWQKIKYSVEYSVDFIWDFCIG